LVFHQDLSRQGVKSFHDGGWSLEVMWALILVTAVRLVVERSLDWVFVAVALLGWMSMLSWGAEAPSLVAGSMALTIGSWAVPELSPAIAAVSWRVAVPAALAALALFGYSAVE